MSSMVDDSIQSFCVQVRWATLICCCPRGRGCLGQRGFVHPIDIMFMLGVLCTGVWIVVSFLVQADGVAGFTQNDASAFVLTCQIFSASFGIAFIAVVLRKSTKRWSRWRRVVVLVVILMFALLFVGHVVINLVLTNDDDEMKFKMAPISTLALFFTNIVPSVLVLTTWVLKFYFQFSQGNPVSITSYNPFDFLSRVTLSLSGGGGGGGGGGCGSRDHERRNYEIMDSDEIREHTEVEVGSGSVQQGGGRGVMLRQSSRFGAMSRFDSMDDDESSLMRRSLLREVSTV
jgi:hypothetical protein